MHIARDAHTAKQRETQRSVKRHAGAVARGPWGSQRPVTHRPPQPVVVSRRGGSEVVSLGRGPGFQGMDVSR